MKRFLSLLLALFLGGFVFSEAQMAVPTTPQLTTLHGFTGGTDGNAPTVRLVADKTGALYGTTTNGGTQGLGSVFQLTPPAIAGGTWGYSVLYSFGSGTDGQIPQSSLFIDGKGNLYGTTYQGGTANLGTVYKLTSPATAGGAWTESVLHSFAGGTDGAHPFGGVILQKGALYGTTQEGGIGICSVRKISCGTVFQLTPAPGGVLTETVLYNFTGHADGGFPDSGLTADPTGALYGTTEFGGSLNPRYGGSIFQLTPPATSGGAWALNPLYDFFSTGMPGYYGDLVLDKTGALYGTSWSGGSSGWGFAYKLSPPTVTGGAWTLSDLWDFSGGVDGSIPFGGLILSGGALYGTTYSGGNLSLCNAIGCGVVYKLSRTASGPWKHTLLYQFQGGNDGATPQGGLLRRSGTLYGTTSAGFAPAPGGGSVFSLK